MGGIGGGMMGNVPIVGQQRHEDAEKEDLSESNYDEFEGYGGGFSSASTPYDADDKEADDIYDSIDRKMDSKRKARRYSTTHTCYEGIQ